jgi:hypothetical protein
MKRKSLFEYLKPPRGFGLTKSGKIFFVFLLAIILAAMATGNNLLFLILACLLSFMIVSGIESELNIRHLDVERIPPSEPYARRPGAISYTVRNRKRNSSRLILVDNGRVKLPRVTMGVPENVRQEKIFSKRGRHGLGRVSILTTYPYGLFEKSISFDLEDEILVFPEPIPCSLSASFGPAGECTGREHESISHVRSYSPGDSLSSIVWKKQHLGLVSRVVQGGGGVGTLIVLLPGGEIEQKLGQATFLILDLYNKGLEFGISINTFFSGMGASLPHKLKVLENLSLAQSIGEPELKEPQGCDHVIYL